VAFEHVAKLGGALDQAVNRYNEFVGSYQSRLEPTFRRFEAAGVKSPKELAGVEPVVVMAREVEALEGQPAK
jgi:DNA recombination protein RmuC